MAHYDIFRDQLGIKYPALGHALWEPNPGRLYSPVEVGDVGFVREGKFHRLFNVLLPADHPSHRRFGVPEDHEQLLPGVGAADHIDSGTLSPNDFCSYGVTVASGGLDVFAREPVGIADVSFSCARKGGAVLSLPVTAQREDTIARGDFAKWIIRYIDSWFAFTRRLGLGIEQMEDIVLVTGRHRTRSWTNVAFYESRAQASFGVQVTNDVNASVTWQVSRGHIQGAMLSQGPSGADLPEDQCIFIRGYRVARTFGLFPRLRGAAGYTPDPSRDNREPELEVVSVPSFPKYRDPLHVLLDYIAERAPNCDFVLVHDDDLDRIRRIGDGTPIGTLQPYAAAGYLQRSEPEISQLAYGTPQEDSLSFENGILRTDTGASMAVLSEELGSWTRTVSPAGLPAPFSQSQDSTESFMLPHNYARARYKNLCTSGQNYRPATTISLLPDGVLEEIFSFYQMQHDALGFPFRPTLELEWRRLVHVCQRWRQIVFSSPFRHNLQLLCTHGTPVRKNLGVWPPIPLVVDYNTYWGGDEGKSPTPSDEDDVIAALEHHDRICRVRISATRSMLSKLATAMQEPFWILTHLWLSSKDENLPVLPGNFLGGSAPNLRSVHLEGIPLPALPMLLLSATDLVDLQLLNIPKTGHFSPDEIVVGLTALTRLKTLSIGFQSSTPIHDRRFVPTMRIILPSIISFNFRGVSEYLEDLVARIDTPLLKFFTITYFNQLTFQIAQLSRFINRTKSLDLSRFKRARVDFGGNNVYLRLDRGQAEQLEDHFTLQISCQMLDDQISSMGQVLSQCFSLPALTSVDDLTIDARNLQPGWEEDVDITTEWSGLLRPFTGAETLHIPRQWAGHITEEMVAKMLPALRSLSFEDEPTCVGP